MSFDNNLCSYEGVNNYREYGFSSKCDLVTKHCTDQSTFLNNVDIYYCKFDEHIGLMLLYAIPYILFCFYWLSSTADYYLEPSVAKLAKYFRFSEALSGITLIALANGMPDVISCYVASDEETSAGIQLSLGALFGASIFATTIILARVLMNSSYIWLNKVALIRDLSFYLITNVYLLVIGSLGNLNLYYAIALYGIYFIFVIFAVVEEFKEKLNNANRDQQSDDLPKEIEFTTNYNQTDLEKYLQNPKMQNGTPLTPKSARLMSRKDSLSLTQEKIANQALLMRIWHFIEIPFNFVRNITIPYMDDSAYTKFRLAGYPIFTTAFMMWRLGLFDDFGWNTFWISLIMSCLFSSVVLFRIAKNPKYFDYLNIGSVIIGFVISVFWLHFVAELLIDFLNVLKIASGYSLNMIGLTILAWGNSSNDFFVDVALAKRGYGIMAISGIFAGQFFNLNIGFGIVMIKKIMKDGAINLNFYDGESTNTMNYLLIIFSILSLLITLIYARWKNYYLSQRFAYFLYVFYAIFLACMFILS
jgi:sodium/potassium/calcium exchanger 6